MPPSHGDPFAYTDNGHAASSSSRQPELDHHVPEVVPAALPSQSPPVASGDTGLHFQGAP